MNALTEGCADSNTAQANAARFAISLNRSRMIALRLLYVAALSTSPSLADWQVTRVPSHDQLNVREAPDVSARKLGALAHDATCIKDLGCSTAHNRETFLAIAESDSLESGRNRWCLIQHRELIGWAASAYLREIPSCD